MGEMALPYITSTNKYAPVRHHGHYRIQAPHSALTTQEGG